MIKEAYCSYEVSKLLKEKGFDEPTIHWYNVNERLINDYPVTYKNFGNPEKVWLAPTHQMAMAWLREKKYISIVITDDEIPLSYKYIIRKYFINDKYRLGTEILKLDSTQFIKYEDAVESALQYTLENLL